MIDKLYTNQIDQMRYEHGTIKAIKAEISRRKKEIKHYQMLFKRDKNIDVNCYNQMMKRKTNEILELQKLIT